ncbi:MAG: copper amine oxidase, partial [Armatimonadota bacterium]
MIRALALATLLLPTLVLPAITPAFAASPAIRGDITVLVNGRAVAFTDGKPQSVAGRTLVPMRAIFEALGANVEYNKELKKITARRDTTVIELTINEKIAKKNGAEVQMGVAPVIRQRSTLVPLRFVAE